MSPLTALTLPWRTFRLAARFFVPLTLWYTIGQLAKWGLSYVSYEIGLEYDVVPLLGLGVTVLVTLAVTVAMLHSVREGLPAIRARSLDEAVAPWLGRNDETLVDAVSRSLFPFLIFYLAWGILVEDARSFAQAASSRGLAEGGIEGATQGLGQTIALEKHLGLAITFTVVFFVLKMITEKFLLSRYPRSAGILMAVFEINWTLFALFTVAQALEGVGRWITGRVLWVSTIGQVPDIPVLGNALGRLTGDLWPTFKDAILLTLVWLIIAGVVLGVHLTEESGLLAKSRRLASARSRLHGMRAVPRDFLEELTQEFIRERWVPVANGWRLIQRAGVASFAVICVLYSSLTLFDSALRRAVYVLVGPETIGWWAPRATLVGYGVGLVAEILRVCLLAAAFDLIVARAGARGGQSPRSGPSLPGPAPGPPAGPAFGPAPGTGPVPAGSFPVGGAPMGGGPVTGHPAPPFSARSEGPGPAPSAEGAPTAQYQVPPR